MTRMRHPHILPPVVIEVADDRVASHRAAGWLPEEPETPTTERPRRTRRAGSDPSEETAE